MCFFKGEYLQYQCKSGLCTQCEKVHHSCVGLPNGDQAISFKTWQPQYVNCYQNRTIEEKVCKDGMFDPVKKICSVTVNTGIVQVLDNNTKLLVSFHKSPLCNG